MFITVYPYNVISILPHFQKKDYFNGNVFLLLFFWIFENLSSMVVFNQMADWTCYPEFLNGIIGFHKNNADIFIVVTVNLGLGLIWRRR